MKRAIDDQYIRIALFAVCNPNFVDNLFSEVRNRG